METFWGLHQKSSILSWWLGQCFFFWGGIGAIPVSRTLPRRLRLTNAPQCQGRGTSLVFKMAFLVSLLRAMLLLWQVNHRRTPWDWVRGDLRVGSNEELEKTLSCVVRRIEQEQFLSNGSDSVSKNVRNCAKSFFVRSLSDRRGKKKWWCGNHLSCQ